MKHEAYGTLVRARDVARHASLRDDHHYNVFVQKQRGQTIWYVLPVRVRKLKGDDKKVWSTKTPLWRRLFPRKVQNVYESDAYRMGYQDGKSDEREQSLANSS